MKKLMLAFFGLSFATGVAGFATASMAQDKPVDKKPTVTSPAKTPVVKPVDHAAVKPAGVTTTKTETKPAPQHGSQKDPAAKSN